MNNRRWTFLLAGMILALPAALSAQGPRAGFFPWWDSPLVSGLDLTDAQRTEIRSVIRDYRGKMMEVREAVQKAEGELDAVFNEDTVDQRRGSEAIDRLTPVGLHILCTSQYGNRDLNSSGVACRKFEGDARHHWTGHR